MAAHFPAAVESDPEGSAAAGPYHLLLDVSRAILAHRDLNALFRDLSRLLAQVLRFDFLNLLLYDGPLEAMRLHILETVEPGDPPPSIAPLPLEATPSGQAWIDQAVVFIRDVAAEHRWPVVMNLLRSRGIATVCYFPLTSAHRRLGAIGFGFKTRREMAPGESEFIQSAIAPVAVAVDNALSQQELAHERDRIRALLDITNALAGNLREVELFRTISACLRTVIPHDYASVVLRGPEAGTLKLRRLDFPAGGGSIRQDAVFPADGSAAGRALAEKRVLVLNQSDIQSLGSESSRILVAEGLRTMVCAPLTTSNGTHGTLNVASFRDRAFSEADATFLGQVAAQCAMALENVVAYQQIAELRDRLAEEKLYLEDEIRTEQNFGEMVGESDAFRRVLRQVETVAPTPATVLVLGETGTGKELVARAIHEWSSRRDRTFVKLNCAAIPTGLLESELFGHERGAFTGAIAQRIGRLELADMGTLFLDEIGDIPLELQPKLLRALQEHEFERLGGTRTLKVDVRLIAATNRDLPAMVANREFRPDLYYRLNVFPIQVPPLRERTDDIPILVRHFAQKFARRMNRHIESIPSEVMSAMVRYAWPGNVRELENLIERAVILSSGSVLRVPGLDSGTLAAAAPVQTLEVAEREHILRALADTAWKLGGPNGAAARLGMKRTTLQSRMKKLGIRRS